MLHIQWVTLQASPECQDAFSFRHGLTPHCGMKSALSVTHKRKEGYPCFSITCHPHQQKCWGSWRESEFGLPGQSALHNPTFHHLVPLAFKVNCFKVCCQSNRNQIVNWHSTKSRDKGTMTKSSKGTRSYPDSLYMHQNTKIKQHSETFT